MTLSQGLQDEVCKKLRMVGLPKEVVLPIVNSLTRQVLAEGPENVVKRLKVLKQAAVDRIAGNPVNFEWIAHSDKGPKGPWRPVWTMLSRNYRQQRRALNAMMVYASFVLPKGTGPTPTQEAKFLDSVERPLAECQERKARMDKAVAAGAFRKGFFALKDALRGQVNLTELSAPPDLWVYLGRHYGRDKKGVERLEKQLLHFLHSESGQPFQSFPSVKQFLGYIGEDYFSQTHPWNGAHRDWREVSPPDEPIGVIGYSQEPGFKFRAFAAPSPVLQGALQPLKEKLLEALHQLPWDCTHNQNKGVIAVQKWLAQGKTCFSVDLSDATNNFPFEIQLNVLRGLDIPEESIRLLELVSRSPFKVSWDTSDKTVTWNVGQPLGSAPSFMAFALAHAVVALDAEIAAGVSRRDLGSTFMLLGDDFITCDPKVHEEYRKRLKWLSIPVSEPKCLVSDQVGEFAGKIIQVDRVFHGYKFKEVSDISFMSVIETLGRQALSRELLSPKQYEYAKMVEALPSPYGLGFNPQGRTLADRYEEYLVLVEELEATKRPVSRRTIASMQNAVISHLKHSCFWYYPALVDRNDKTIVEQRGYTVTSKTLLERILQNRLIAANKISGDPRPNLLQDWARRQRDVVQPVVNRVRESQAARESGSETTSALSLAPSVLQDGETNHLGEPTEEPTPRGRPSM